MSRITPWLAVKGHFVWQYKLPNYFLRHLAGSVLAATASRIAAQFSQLFSLFFPLKIIFILGSNTVPVFLQGRMTMETRGVWIAGLAIAALVLYLANIALDLNSNRMTRRGGSRLTRLPIAVEELPDGNHAPIGKLYAIACNGYADMIVFILGALGLLMLNPVIFLAMAAIMFIQLAMINGLCALHSGWLGRVGAAIRRTPGVYLRYLAAINFLCVFVLLLLGYLITGGIDSVSAILTLLLARKTFQSMGRFAVLAVRLEQARSGNVHEERYESA